MYGRAAVEAVKKASQEAAKKAAQEAAKKAAQKAAEQTAKDMAKKIGQDLGKDARREFHDAKRLTDRTLQELKEDAKALYDAAGKTCPRWMSP